MTAVDDVTGAVKSNKTLIIGISVGTGILLLMICICCIRCRMKKKKKKEMEKIKMKGSKPSNKLKRIQPNKIERKAMEELGTMKFSLQYDKSSEMLMVKVLETEDVPVRDLSGYAYAFVVVKLLPYHELTEVEYKTRNVRAGFWPFFGDLFTFVIDKDSLAEQVLYLYQYELNQWAKKDGIGMITMEMKSVDILKEKAGEVLLSRKLRPYDPLVGLEVESGAVFLSMEYDREEWELNIKIRQADVIPMNEDKDKANTYVKLKLLNGQDEILETANSCVRKGTLQPMFDDERMFQIPDQLLEEARLVVKLKSKGFIKKSHVIGETTILPTNEYWRQLLEKDYTEGWFSVFTKPKNK